MVFIYFFFNIINLQEQKIIVIFASDLKTKAIMETIDWRQELNKVTDNIFEALKNKLQKTGSIKLERPLTGVNNRNENECSYLYVTYDPAYREIVLTDEEDNDKNLSDCENYAETLCTLADSILKECHYQIDY
jgi:hypothetical protein